MSPSKAFAPPTGSTIVEGTPLDSLVEAFGDTLYPVGTTAPGASRHLSNAARDLILLFLDAGLLAMEEPTPSAPTRR